MISDRDVRLFMYTTIVQAVCRKNGVTVDKEDVDFLLRVHR